MQQTGGGSRAASAITRVQIHKRVPSPQRVSSPAALTVEVRYLKLGGEDMLPLLAKAQIVADVRDDDVIQALAVLFAEHGGLGSAF